MKHFILPPFILSVVLLWSSPGHATFGPPSSFEIDPETPAEDLVQPETPALTLEGITRGIGPQPCPNRPNDCQIVGSLDPYGFINFALSPTQDEVGYIIEVVSGTAPTDLKILNEPLHPNNEQLFVYWEDGATNVQEPLEFELRVIPVNRAGEQGTPSAPLLISDPGRAPTPASMDMSDEDMGADQEDMPPNADMTLEEDEEAASCASVRPDRQYLPPSWLLLLLMMLPVFRRRPRT